ncbi:MAG: hypothetical protein RIT27_252 [Pseudomonadota bacterium]|jgi:hypothetical protein
MSNPKKFIFSPIDFNEHHVLKAPSLLVLVLIYLNKYFLLVVLPSVGGGDLSVIAKWFKIDAVMMLSCLPALAVLIALLYRMPPVKQWAKTIWEHGWVLLLLSSAMDFIVLTTYVYIDKRILDTGTIILMLIDVAIMVYLIRSAYLKEMFKEFPEDIEKK